MQKYNLSNTEKRILKSLAESHYQHDTGAFADLSQAELNVASERLKTLGLIIAHYSEENGLAYAGITDAGMVYLKENSTLENPIDENEIRKLQLENLRYEKKIRIWKFLSIVSWIFGVVGWLLALFNV